MHSLLHVLLLAFQLMLQNLLLQQQTSKGILQAGTLSNYFLLFLLHTEVSCLSLCDLYPLIVFFSPVKGGVDAKEMFQDYINCWIQEKRLSLLESCKLDKVHLFFLQELGELKFGRICCLYW